MLVPGTPNKADVCSDPHEDEFERTFIDDDGVRWFAIPNTKGPSAFCEWAHEVADA